MTIFSPRPLALQSRPRSLIDVTLDPAQAAAVRRAVGGAMLILGEAGHGKTTLALHRLAYLYKHATGRFRAVVLVPHAGLMQLLQPLVRRLGADVLVEVYERWARRQARRAFGDIPRRESSAVAPAVQRMKRHAALLALLREVAAEPPGIIDDDLDAPPPNTRAHAQRGDLQHVFGDGQRMHRLAQQMGESERSVLAILEHTHQQFLLRAEEAYAHIDAERLIPLDGRSLDVGTAAENTASIDTEDYAVLFEIDRLRARAKGVRPTRPRPYDCIVLDEAQEFAPLELALIGRSLTRGGTLIVAGDADQQTDPSVSFKDWETSMRALRAPDYAEVSLPISHRCPPTVVALARALRGDASPERTAPALVPPVHAFPDETALISWLCAEVQAIADRDPSASFCILVRKPVTARRLAERLRGKIACKLVLDDEFTRHRGVDVTTIEHVKGLEFDFVVVADVNAANYPASPEARRALYVATTRVRHQLALAYVGELSPWLSF